MDFLKTAVSYITFQRFYRYLLKRLLGGVFVPEFGMEQLDVQLFKGIVQLVDMKLNTAKINAALKTANIKFSVRTGSIGKLRVRIPWRNVLHDPCKVYISEIHLRIARCPSQASAFSVSSRDSPEGTQHKSVESVKALTQLVRQVLWNIEACVDRVVVELDDDPAIVFEAGDLVVHSTADGIKRFLMGRMDLSLSGRSDRVVSVSPIEVCVDARDEETLKISASVDSVSAHVLRRKTLRNLLTVFARLQSARCTDSTTMFESVMEEPVVPSSGKLWYEEIYAVIEAEVIRSETEKDDFTDALEAPDIDVVPDAVGIASQSVSFAAVVKSLRVSLLEAERDCPGLSLVVDDIRATHAAAPSLSIGEYGLYLTAVDTSPMFASMMSEDDDAESSVYASVVDSEDSFGHSELEDDQEDEEAHEVRQSSSDERSDDRESIFFDSDRGPTALAVQDSLRRGACGLFSPSGDRIVWAHNVPVSVAANLSDGKWEIDHSAKIQVSMSPRTIANLSLVGQVVGSIVDDAEISATAKTGSLMWTLTVGEGLVVSVPLGNGHLLEFLCRDPIVWDSLNGGSVDALEAVCDSVNVPMYIRDVRIATSRLQVGVEAKRIDVTNNGLHLLDLELKIQSLIDQIAMVKDDLQALLGIPPVKPATRPGLAFCLAVDSVELHHIRLTEVKARVCVASNHPLIVVTVKECCTLDQLVTSPGGGESINLTLEVVPGPMTRISLIVELTGLQLIVGPDHWEAYRELVRYLAPPVSLVSHAAPLITAPPRPTHSVYTVRLADCVAVYGSSPAGAFLIDSIETTFGVLSTVDSKTPAGVSLRVGRAALWLAKSPVSPGMGTTGTKWLRECGYVQLLVLSDCNTIIKWKGDDSLAVQAQVGGVRADLKADTYEGLGRFINRVVEDVGALRPQPAEPAEAAEVKIPPFAPPVPALVIKEDFVNARIGRGGSRLKPGDVGTVSMVNESGTRWLVDPGQLVVVHDHVTVGSKKSSRLGKARDEFNKRQRESANELRSISVCVEVESVRVFLIGGLDWQGAEFLLSSVLGRSARRQTSAQSLVCLELDRVAVDALLLDPKQGEAERWKELAVTVEDVRVRDGVAGSVYQYVLTRWSGKPSLTGANMLAVSFSQRGDTRKADLGIAPVSITLDQDTLEFISKFIAQTSLCSFKSRGDGLDLEVSDDPSADDSADPEDSGDVEDGERIDEAIVGQFEEGTQTPPDSPDTSLFQSLIVSSIHADVNYKAKRVSMSRLRRGDALQLLNLVPLLEGLHVTLREVRMVDLADADDGVGRLLTAWSKDLNKAQIFKSLSSITPLRSISNLSAGFSELINQPLRQIRKKDGKFSRGLLRGFSSFFRTLTIESLNLADVVVSSAQNVLEAVDEATSRPVDAEIHIDDEDDEEWTSVEVGARERALDPASAVEGLRTGSDALIRGLTVRRPLSGAPGYILQPAIGAAQAVSVVLRGARSTVDSGKHRAETERKYKEPYMEGEILRTNPPRGR